LRHYFHWRGKYDASKAKVILLLAQESNTWYSCSQLHSILGVPVGSVRNIVRRLHVMRPPYIRRRLVGNYYPGPYHYEYHIGVRGGKWLTNAMASGMPIERYYSEVKEWQHQRDTQIGVGGVGE
jgi:hypothetical protein